MDILQRQPGHPMVMIGDRGNDMRAARKVGADAVGVLWGYGSVAELQDAGATALVDTPQELGRWFRCHADGPSAHVSGSE